ncbi:MAG: tetratricopeptide repeat protein [Bacteroidota bacterium]
MERYLYIIFFVFLPFNTSLSQTSTIIDSLKSQLKIANEEEKVGILNEIGWQYKYSDIDKSKEYVLMGLQMSEELGLDHKKATAYRNLGAIYLLTGVYDSAILSYEVALNLFKELEDAKSTAKVLNDMSVTYYRTGDLDKVLECSQEAQSIYEKTDYLEGQPAALMNIGNVYRNRGDYATALEYYLKSLKISEKAHITSGMVMVVNNLGITYESEGKLDKALEYYLRGLELSEELGNKRFESVYLANIADVYKQKQEWEKSLEFHERSLSLAKELDDLEGIAFSLMSIGTLNESLENYEKAILFIRDALHLSDSIGLFSSKIHSQNILSQIYRKVGRIDKALDAANQALEGAELLGYPERAKAAHHNLSEAYAIAENFERAYTHYLSFTYIKDSIFNENKTSQLNELRTKYESEKKEQQIAKLELEKANAGIKRNGLIAGLVALFVISLISVSWLRYRMRKNRQLREQEIRLSQEKIKYYKTELKQFTRNMVMKNARIAGLNEELEKVKEEISFNCPSYNGQIDKLMQSTILTDDEWVEFKLLFEQVNQGFFGNLRTKHPDLSIAEIRLAALLKLNLNTHEIANMLGISSESVNKSRYRLRKKLALQKEANLEEFIMKV